MTRTIKTARDQQDSRVTAKLISRIKSLIASGAISPGSKFPPERELAKEFGVNRASVRQALKVLEIMGVLTQRVGDGTYLSESAESILDEPIDFLVLLDDLSHHELFETRLIVEPELTARAAERATAEDMAALRNAILAMERSKTTRERLDADLAFHEAIFRASGNRICHLLFKGIHRSLLTSMGHLSDRVSLDQPLMFHRRIYGAIRERNAGEARQAMLEHITDARSLLVRPAGKRPLASPGFAGKV
ncbi:MAG TPA: FadR/GntR family transcriptional regulator [Terracidiphilus sp.]|jgi:GntR family transcriptional repressor for pyruvate dehydrogenase complex